MVIRAHEISIDFSQAVVDIRNGYAPAEPDYILYRSQSGLTIRGIYIGVGDFLQVAKREDCVTAADLSSRDGCLVFPLREHGTDIRTLFRVRRAVRETGDGETVVVCPPWWAGLEPMRLQIERLYGEGTINPRRIAFAAWLSASHMGFLNDGLPVNMGELQRRLNAMPPGPRGWVFLPPFAYRDGKIYQTRRLGEEHILFPLDYRARVGCAVLNYYGYMNTIVIEDAGSLHIHIRVGDTYQPEREGLKFIREHFSPLNEALNPLDLKLVLAGDQFAVVPAETDPQSVRWKGDDADAADGVIEIPVAV